MKTALLCALGFCCILLAAPAIGGLQKGDFELTIAATGATPATNAGFAAGGNVALGAFVADNLELSLRQGAAYTDLSGAAWQFSTQGAADYHLPLIPDKLYLFAGGFAGLVYGDGVETAWSGGPEGGLLIPLSAHTLLRFTAQGVFPFRGGDPSADYLLGITFKW